MAETSCMTSLNLDTTTARGAPLRNFDVFINHRGPNVKRSFVSHLVTALKATGIRSFVDYEDLLHGESTWDDIVSAIRQSKVHIAIFSPDYASSTWCLEELHEILECRRNGCSLVFLPVFFNVHPSDLRYLPSPKSCYDEGFAKHRDRNPACIPKWEKALREASLLTGWTFDSTREFEGALVKNLVSKVRDVLKPTLLDVAKYPVAVEEKLQEALGLMKPPNMQQGLQKFGIYGMGGVGKTTLAKLIYNEIHRCFDGFCFIESVRSKALNGLSGVQSRIISDLLKSEHVVHNISHGKELMRERCAGLKILLILDDVDDREQLEALLTPFKHLKDGSQVVITTRDENILRLAKAQQKLCIEGLSEAHSHMLFNWHAFQRPEEPPKEFEVLAKRVINACGGLPLALEILGAHLSDERMAIWKETVKTLQGGIGHHLWEVTKSLRISFDGLRKTEQLMFLDVACFMLGESEDHARKVWSDLDAAELFFQTLKRKSLVKVNKLGRLTMHDLLRDMGRQIVVEKHANAWERSHLWDARDVRCVLRGGKGASELRALRLDYDNQEEYETSCLDGMDSLKFLVLPDGLKIRGDFGMFPKELTWFEWFGCPLHCFPRELDLSKVAVLNLKSSSLASLSNGHKFENLRELRLRFCEKFRKLPHFGDCCNRLEVLDLGGCWNLESLPESIGCLSSTLTRLELRECGKLTVLPDAIGQLTRLEVLDLGGCSGLESVPESIGCLSSTLTRLDLRGCEKLTVLPDAIGQLTRLKVLDLGRCSGLERVPESIGCSSSTFTAS